MIERIDLFLPPRSQYQVLQSFTCSLAEALSRLGVRVRILQAEKENPQEFLDAIFSDRPDCTLSFNGLLPDEEGRFFCDMINIPHVACLVDAPQHFTTLTKSRNSIITCVDRFYCDFFEKLKFQNALFMPHAVDCNQFQKVLHGFSERPYDVTMLASFIDYEAVLAGWKKDPMGKIWEEAAEIIMASRNISSAEAVTSAINRNLNTFSGVDPSKMDLLEVLDQIEDYVNGKGRMDLIKHIEGANVQIFGAGNDRWQQHLGKDFPNVTVHGPVSFSHALRLMRQSKIILNSRLSVKNGAHERIFTGIASGAAVITNDNIFMGENFKDREDILFYRHGQWDELNETIQEYTQDPKKHFDIVQKGQETVKQGHTWDHRAAKLVSDLAPILDQLSG